MEKQSVLRSLIEEGNRFQALLENRLKSSLNIHSLAPISSAEEQKKMLDWLQHEEVSTKTAAYVSERLREILTVVTMPTRTLGENPGHWNLVVGKPEVEDLYAFGPRVLQLTFGPQAAEQMWALLKGGLMPNYLAGFLVRVDESGESRFVVEKKNA